ncbi:folate family ECF transporter S component [Weissella bombi]|uniref:ECF transporter S component, folate family n=1 Tax=Weissella bombi TaxID=1505725 RepID=A0A1C4AEV2_9LACO|nr:folate family ECF transporter S component [Weissella bombi]SCB93143.1 ECF transporter S component, folate family [Weissella bombi]
MKTLAYGLPRLRTKQLALLGILMALQLVISRFSLGTATLKVGFTFLIVGIIAKWYGPYWGMLVATVMDVISSLMNGYGYFWGFTISAIVAAGIYGFSFYGRQTISWLRLIITVFLVLLIVNVMLNTLWVTMIGNIHNMQTIMSLLWLRIIKQVIFWPIQSILLYFLLNNKTIEEVHRKI